MAVVRRVYELAAGGRTDREVGAATGLALKHVAEILTNPFYIGRLWSGEPSALGALVDPSTWEHVQSLRARYSRRHRGGVNRRQYGLGGLLACAACGRRLIGHVGRYRHMDACEAFTAAAPRRVQRDGADARPARPGRVVQGRRVRGRDRPRLRARGRLLDAQGQHGGDCQAARARRRRAWPGLGSAGSASAPRCVSPRIATSGSSRRRWRASTPRQQRR